MVASPGSAAYRGSWRYDRPNFVWDFMDDDTGQRLGTVYRDGHRWAWAVYGPERQGVSTRWGDCATAVQAKATVEREVEKFGT